MVVSFLFYKGIGFTVVEFSCSSCLGSWFVGVGIGGFVGGCGDRRL